MRFSSFVILAATKGVLAVVSPFDQRDANPPAPNDTDTTIPNRFIIEFANGVDPHTAADELAKTGLSILRIFASDIFNGVSVEHETASVDSLKEKELVAQAWQSKKVKLAAPVKAPQTFGGAASASDFSVHTMTGVDKLHASGIFGKGAKIAAVDTGVQYTHPALGGGFGPGFKVSGGYDLVGDKGWGSNTTTKSPDPDPMDELGHGTHVSGIIIGQQDSFIGVAPEATFSMYKVFGSADGTDDDTLIDAFLMAYEDGADIITCSVGGAGGFKDDPWGLVANRLVDQGVVVVLANGNDGQQGPFSESSGALGEHVLAAASVEPDVLPTANFTATIQVGNSHSVIGVPYQASNFWFPSTFANLRVVALDPDPTAPNDGCHVPATRGNYTDAVVLIKGSTCELPFLLAELGIDNFLQYYDTFPISPLMYEQDIVSTQSGIISTESAMALLNVTRSGGTATADFTSDPAQSLIFRPYKYGAVGNFFSSIGPSNDLSLKPDVAGPGGDIFSTYPTDGWAILSGTSMATPYIAGVAALYIGKNGGRAVHGPDFAKTLGMRIASSGMSLKWDDGQMDGKDFGLTASVLQVGTGLVNATKVLYYETELSPSRFSLNDTHHFSRYHSVDVTNRGAKPVTYTFSLEPSGAFAMMDTDPTDPYHLSTYATAMIAPFSSVPTVFFPGGTFIIQPGQTKTAEINFMYPSNTDPAKIPLYGGKVIITGDNGESLAVPYFGVGASLHTDIGSIFNYNVTKIISGLRSKPVAAVPSWTMNPNPFVKDYPLAEFILTFASTELRWDIFESSWKERDWVYPPVVGKNGYVGSAAIFQPSTQPRGLIPNTSSEYLTVMPAINIDRSYEGVPYTFGWLGQLGNGSVIQPGSYKLRLAALMPFGNTASSDNWDIYPISEFHIVSVE